MATVRLLIVGLALVASLQVAQQAQAVILAEDDFSAAGSGTGWAAGNDWEGLGGGIVSTNPGGGGAVESFRDFATPIDATNQVTYIRFDYTQLVPGDGANWGGLAFFEGVEGAAGEETFFVGNNSAGPQQYSIDPKGPADIFSGVPIDGQSHTIIASIDTTGADHVYTLWVDNFNISSPNVTSTVVGGGPIDAAWGTLRVASDGANTDEVDNLTIATTSGEVGLISSDATLTIDRSTGNISLSSPTPLSNVVGYKLSSAGGAFNPENWVTITDNYDNAAGPGDGSVDSDDDWDVLSAPGSTTDASEFEFLGDGGSIGASPVDLGNFWQRTPIQDVVGTVIIDDGGSPLPLGLNVVYTGDAAASGDLNGDGAINAADWANFKLGQGAVSNAMTAVEAYQFGDLNGDFNHSLADFLLFEEAYDLANGVGAFAALTQNIPEPASLVLLVGGALAMCTARSRSRGSQLLMLLVMTIFSAGLLAEPARAVIFAEDDFSATGSGTGWAAGDDWDGIVNGGVANTDGQAAAFRAFATPLEPYFSDKVYIAFDFRASGSGQWGGVSMFEAATGGDETLFIGKPGQGDFYGLDLHGGIGSLPAEPANGTPVDGNFHRMIVEVDFDDDGTSPFDDKYSLWIDSFDQANPTHTVTVDNSPIDMGWQSMRIASDGANPIQVDNLIVTDEAGLVFVADVLEVIVNKTTGEVTLENNTGAGVELNAYSMTSATNMLNPGLMAGDFDQDGDVDGQDFLQWQQGNGAEFDAQDLTNWQANHGASGGGEGGWESLASQDLGAFPAGNGSGDGWEEGANPSTGELEEYFLTGSSTLANGGSVSLGDAYGGGELGDTNVVFQYISNGEVRTAAVNYVTGGALAAIPEPTSIGLCVIGVSCLGWCSRRRG